MADTNLGVIRIKGALGVGNVPTTDVAARVARHPHLRGTATTEEGLDDGPATVTGAATLGQEEPRRVSRSVVTVQLSKELGLHNPNLRRQRVGNLELPATDRLTDHSGVDQHVGVLSQGRGTSRTKRLTRTARPL